jgi:hypothetical protein
MSTTLAYQQVPSQRGRVEECVLHATVPLHSCCPFQVLGLLVETGHRFVATTEAMLGEGATNVPVGTAIVRIEQGRQSLQRDNTSVRIARSC